MFPTLFEGTRFEMASWDICLLIGFITVTVLGIIKRPPDFPVSRLGIFVCALLMAYFGILGAKVLFIFLHWQSISQEGYPLRHVFRTAGYASLGTLAFGLLAIFIFTKFRIKRRISFLKAGDYAAPFMLLQMAFVRLGCFAYGCCYGKPTDLPWAVTFKTMPPPQVPSHPTQIYTISFLIFLYILGRHIYKKNTIPGITLFSSFALYGFSRFLVELLRVDSVVIWRSVTLAQITALSIGVISSILLSIVVIRKREAK